MYPQCQETLPHETTTETNGKTLLPLTKESSRLHLIIYTHKHGEGK